MFRLDVAYSRLRPRRTVDVMPHETSDDFKSEIKEPEGPSASTTDSDHVARSARNTSPCARGERRMRRTAPNGTPVSRAITSSLSPFDASRMMRRFTPIAILLYHKKFRGASLLCGQKAAKNAKYAILRRT